MADPAPVKKPPTPKPQSDKELREALESNRLYLNKVRKQCTKEDFVDLKELKLFLFEVLIDSLEVNSLSTLGLLPDDKKLTYISATVEFLNSTSCLEICERDMPLKDGRKASETNILQTIGNAALYQTNNTPAAPTETQSGTEIKSDKEQKPKESEEEFKTKWTSARGKSCLFSMTSFQVIHQIEKFPVVVRVTRRVRAKQDNKASDESEPIGYAHIRLPEDFSLSVLQSCKEGVVLPVSSVHREKCDVRNVFGVKKGKLEVFLRLTSFGPAIITAFHTVGADRRYVFKPSPASAYIKEKKEPKHPRDEVLKPIIAEEDKAVGITVLKEADIFQKPVVWKGREDIENKDKKLLGKNPSKISVSLRVPRSDISLCRDTTCPYKQPGPKEPIELYSKQPSSWKKGGSNISLCTTLKPPVECKKEKDNVPTLCDWHKLVGTQIKNSPKGNCGCISSAPTTRDRKGPEGTKPQEKTSPAGNPENKQLPENNYSRPKLPSRLMKIKSPDRKPSPIKGFGLEPEPKACGCPCPSMKDSFKNKTLFLM